MPGGPGRSWNYPPPMTKIWLPPVVTLLLAVLPCAADTVTLRSGTKINGTVVSEDINQVILRDARGNFRTFDRAEVAKIESNDLGKKPDAAPPAAPPNKVAPPAAEDADAPEAPKSVDGEVRDVIAEGAGKDDRAAERDALRSAVSQVVGVLVVASDVVKNDSLIESKILTHSDGYVKRFERIGEPRRVDGQVRVKIHAWVQAGLLAKDLSLNAIPVKDVDVRSLQGASDTLDDRAKSAEDLVAALFTDYPAKFLVAEPLEPRRVGGDAEATTFEVPVRVRVDEGKWRTWCAEAKRVLDAIATKKGVERWNMRSPGWVSLAGPRLNPPKSKDVPKARPGASKPKEETRQQIRARELRGTFWLDRFIPESDRKAGVAGITPDGRADTPALNCAESKRVLIILDALGGSSSWWQLPESAWERMRNALPSGPSIVVRLLDSNENEVVSPVSGWSEFVESDRAGASPTEVIKSNSKIGGRVLDLSLTGETLIQLGAGEGFGGPHYWTRAELSFSCWDQLDSRGQMPESNFARNSCATCGILAFPAGCAKVGWGNGGYVCSCPVITFPFRFSVPPGLIPEDGKLRVQSEIQLKGAPTAGPGAEQ
jgi:hypothetical protein